MRSKLKKLIALLILVHGTFAQAGSQADIPVELLDLDNQGRVIFVKNALAKIGVSTASYKNLRSFIIAGEETAQRNDKGADLSYVANIETSLGVFMCQERMLLGSYVKLRPDLVGQFPIACTLSN